MKIETSIIVCPSGGRYFLNELPADLARQVKRDSGHLFSQRCHLFFTKNVHDPLVLAAELAGWFSRIEQPTQAQVKAAMILTIDEDYMLKAGGGAIADTLYSSSLRWLQADPKTGQDCQPVLIKKFSTNFSDVLITSADVAALLATCFTDAHQRQLRQDRIDDVIRMLHTGYVAGNIYIAEKGRGSKLMPFTAEHESRLISLLNTDEDRALAHRRIPVFQALLQEHIDFVSQRGHGILNASGTRCCRVATAGYVADYTRRLRQWDNVEQALMRPPSSGKHPELLPQLTLFLP